MDISQKTLYEAIKLNLPNMLNDEKALGSIVEIIEDYLHEYYDAYEHIVESLTGLGLDSEFSINIHEFHGIYWVSAPEFNDEGYFLSLDDAIAYAKERYEPYITDYEKDNDN